jgi:hypothetical protein
MLASRGNHRAQRTATLLLMLLSLTGCMTDSPRVSATEDGRVISYSGVPGMTALAALREVAEVATLTREFGDFVTGINGMIGDGDSSFWAFYVNGEMSRTGAGRYIVQEGDRLQWKLQDR